jgi:hypothetical protein
MLDPELFWKITKTLTAEGVSHEKSSWEGHQSFQLGIPKVATVKLDESADSERSRELKLGTTTTVESDPPTKPYFMAAETERLLRETHSIVDLGRRMVEVVTSWDETVRSFEDNARRHFRFPQPDALRKMAQDHVPALMDLCIERVRHELFYSPIAQESRLIDVSANDLHFSLDSGEKTFQFSGSVIVDSIIGEETRAVTICPLVGFGEAKWLNSGLRARLEVNKTSSVTSGRIMGNCLEWNPQAPLTVQSILIS